MPAITVETVEKLNIGSVLAGLKARERAEAAVEAQARALGVTTQQLTREIVAQEKATAQLQAQQSAQAMVMDGLAQEARDLTTRLEAGTLSTTEYGRALAEVRFKQESLGKAWKQSGAAGGEVERSTRATAAAMGNLRAQLIDVGVQLQGGQNPLTILSQQGPQIAEALLSAEGASAAAASSLGTLLSVAGPLGLAIGGVLVPAWLDYSAAQEQATAAAEAWTDAQIAAAPLVDRSAKDVEALAKLTEKSASVDEQKARIVAKYNEELEASNAPLRARIATLQAEADTTRVTSSSYQERQAELKRLNAEIAANNRAAAEGATAAALVIEYNAEEAESERVVEERKRRTAAARKAAKDATKEEAEALKELLFLRGVDEEIAKLGDLFVVPPDALASIDALNAKWAAAGDAREAAILADLDLAEKQRAADEAAAAAYAKRLSDTADLAGATADIVGGLYDYIEAHSDTMSETQKKVALRLFKIQKVLAGSEIAVNTVKGVSVALASAPPPANLIPAGIALGQGLAQGAALAATPTPTFDDTPQAVMARSGAPRAQVSLHPDDILIAGKTDASVIGQAMALAMSQAGLGGGGGRRQSLGMDIAQNPVNALLTRQLKRATRGKWSV